MRLAFTLKKQAQKKGGDRYEASLDSGEVMVVYFPQPISRPNGTPVKVIFATLEVAE